MDGALSVEPILKLEGVTKDYGKGSVAVHALRGIDLELEKGSFVAVAGPSGSGKTTLINVVSGLDMPTSGSVVVDGREVSAMTHKELSRLRLLRIGLVFQSYNLIPVLTAYENAEYVLMMQGVPASQRRDKVMGLLKEVGLEGMENRFPRNLSGGQQQRVAIARAIASEPALVLADEPTAHVDSKTAAGLLDLMVELNEGKGVTFLFSTHDHDVMTRAKRLIVLTDGMIEMDSRPDVPGE